jgi:glycosyltransferase involved in cell wall biosynthesis
MAMAAAVPATAVRRVALVAPAGEPLHLLRASLAEQLAARRHRILVIAPEFSGADVAAFDEMGAERAELQPETNALKLFSDWKAVSALKSVLAQWSPHVVVGCGPKSMVYAALAAKSVGTERIVLVVDGLPEHRFSGDLGADEMPAWRYSQALRAADEAIFYNRDDMALLKRLGILPGTLAAHAVAGGGVDLKAHDLLPLPPLGDGLVFLMRAPLDRRKGVLEYCEAACALGARAPNTRFLLAGPAVVGEYGLEPRDLAAYPAVEFVGAGDDMQALLGRCHFFVYPSHAEGMPQAVLEAMAAGRPIITSNTAGCRDTVDERVNGCLVEPRNAKALSLAMESFLKRPDLIPSIARASRAKAERFCDIDGVSRTLLRALGVE